MNLEQSWPGQGIREIVHEIRQQIEADPSARLDRVMLIALGKRLDQKIRDGVTVRDFLMCSLLRIRNKAGVLVPFVPNEAQRMLGQSWGRKNIVLTARQLGMTTYVAARFFISSVTRPGCLTVQVAHDQQSAEDIFRN